MPSSNNVTVKHKFGPRLKGDLAEFWADAQKAAHVLGCQTRRSLTDMCRDTWNWQKKNLNGYGRKQR